MARSLGWYLPEQLILEVTLAGSRPPIWRRLEVHSGLTLHDLHFVIQCAFAQAFAPAPKRRRKPNRK